MDIAADQDEWSTDPEGFLLVNPPHVGDFLKTEVLEAYGLDLSASAKVLDMREGDLAPLLAEQIALSGDVAIRFEKAFGLSADTLMRMQAHYDLAQARRHEHEINVTPFQPATVARASI